MSLYDIAGEDDDVLAGLVELMGDDDESAALGMALASGDDDYGSSGADELAQLLAVSGRRGRGGRAAQALRALARRAGGGGGGGIPQAVARAAAAQRLARSGVLVAERRPNRSREYVVGFDSVAAVAAGGSITVTQTPQVVFRAERLIIPSDIGGLFSVLNVLIGKNPAFAAAGAVPARTFSELGVGVRLQCDTVQPGMSIALQIQNISGAPARFTASFIGSAVE